MSLFQLGSLYQTRGVADAIAASPNGALEVSLCIERYSNGDWGLISGDDAEMNQMALEDGSRIMAAYDTDSIGKIWIITEAADENGNRSVTTVLFPEEY